MTDTFADDGWDELTRELGVEKEPPVKVFWEVRDVNGTIGC